MALRAPEPEPVPEDSVHQDIVGHWEKGRFWRVMDRSHTRILAETSNPDDDAFREALNQPGATCQRSYRFGPADMIWLNEEAP